MRALCCPEEGLRGLERDGASSKGKIESLVDAGGGG